MPCKVKHCKVGHQQHFCRHCKDTNSDHPSWKCQFAPRKKKHYKIRCKAENCHERHTKHYCKVCHNKDSDHLASECPIGKTLFHGTKKEFAESILKNGWKVSQGGRMGKGVYLTPEWNVAANAARRWHRQGCTQFAVIECVIDQNSDKVEQGTHPAWHMVSDSQFLEFVVRQDFIKRIKIIKIHSV